MQKGCHIFIPVGVGRCVHGHSRVNNESPEHRAWRGIIQRTSNKNAANYARFGGSGITVDPRWRNFSTFLKDVGLKPSPVHTLGRFFDLTSYRKGGAFWQSRFEQKMSRLANNYLDGNTKTWPRAKLQAVIQFIASEMGVGPELRAADLLLQHLYQRPKF